MKTLRRASVILVAILAALYLLVCAFLFVYQRSLIYFPQPRSNANASALLSLRVGSETIHVSMLDHPGPRAMIYFGGNAEDVSRDIPDLTRAFPNAAIYALHYPGYGGSSGTPSQDAIFAAALALFDRVHTEHTDVVLVGRSLGSGVAVWLASQRPVVRLVLVTPYDSLVDPAEAQYPLLPVRWLLRDRFESDRYAPQVTAPTRIIIAEKDEIIPRSSSDRLTTRFRRGIASVIVLPDVGHNTVQTAPNYWNLLAKP